MSAANGRNLDALVGHSPVYSDSLVSLYQGDALALLELFPSGLVDVVVMDPPYGVGTGEVGDWTKGGWAGAFSNALLHVCGPLYRATKPDAAMYVFTSWARMADWIVKWREYFKMQGFIVWDKGRHSGTFGPYSWQFHWEGIYYGLKGPRKIRKYMPDIVRMKNKPDHAMQKPTELCRMLIEASTDEGDLVLDPFCGTGATLLAARECGRRAIGFEILPERCEIAASRLRNGGLFDMPNPGHQGTGHLMDRTLQGVVQIRDSEK